MPKKPAPAEARRQARRSEAAKKAAKTRRSQKHWAAYRAEQAAKQPRVINLRGLKGAIPQGAVYIGGSVNRGGWRLAASKWANPKPPRRNATREERAASIRK
jgi:hypothetical protein